MTEHLAWLQELELEYGRKLKFEEAEKILAEETAKKFSQVLETAGIFKNDQAGREGFDKFLQTVGIESIKNI